MSDTVEVYFPNQSKPVLLDCQDFCDIWQHHRWRVHNGYLETGKRTRGLGQILLQTSGRSRSVDHINGNPFDNRRCNLRIATQQQNTQNSRKTTKPCSSQFKGVFWNTKDRKWYGSVKCNGKRHFLGSFDNEHDAARAYNDAARKFFGEFARLNIIPTKP